MDGTSTVKSLELRTILNGQVIQQANTRAMVFGVQELISRTSWLVPSKSATSSSPAPSDLGELDPPVFLTAGDTVQLHIEGIGGSWRCLPAW
jgi:2-keto-4-pentenoate hydratase/2-oxohepta-3-ene-1,7-dioic acid hydratase in catechol pathway